MFGKQMTETITQPLTVLFTFPTGWGRLPASETIQKPDGTVDIPADEESMVSCGNYLGLWEFAFDQLTF